MEVGNEWRDGSTGLQEVVAMTTVATPLLHAWTVVPAVLSHE